MYKVIHGLKLLVQSDPSLEMFQQQTGEHVIVGAGELHLEVGQFGKGVKNFTENIFVALSQGPAGALCQGRTYCIKTHRTI